MQDSREIAVIFDMDGVLIDSADAHLKSWQVLAAAIGTQVTKEQCAALFGRHNQDIIPSLFGNVPPERVRELANSKESIYRDLVQAAPPIVPGATSLLQELYEAGVRLAIGSSGPPENIALVLDALKARDKIGVVVSGADVTRGKPDPQVFEIAGARLAIPPGNCIVIEDTPVGIEAAQRAGMKSVAVLLYHEAAAFQSPSFIVRQLADLSVGDLLSL